jgi:hypothetical protein
MDELACRVVAANAHGYVVRAFTRNMGTRVRHVTKRALVCWGVAISHGQCAVIELSVYDLEKGGPLPGVMIELIVKRMAHSFRAGPFCFTDDDETHIKRGVMYATE